MGWPHPPKQTRCERQNLYLALSTHTVLKAWKFRQTCFFYHFRTVSLFFPFGSAHDHFKVTRQSQTLSDGFLNQL